MEPIEGHFHFIGIGGAGMSVVAELLAARGARVTGSDCADSDVLARLNEKGIRAFVGHDATHVDMVRRLLCQLRFVSRTQS